MNKIYKKNNKGFALLFTIVVVSLLLAISIGISDITYKQQMLSSLAEDSKIASNQADNALECGLYYSLDIFSDTPTNTYQCGPGATNTLTYTTDYGGSFAYASHSTLNAPCYYIKAASSTTTGTSYTLEGHGFNVCNDTNLRKVERVETVSF